MPHNFTPKKFPIIYNDDVSPIEIIQDGGHEKFAHGYGITKFDIATLKSTYVDFNVEGGFQYI
jgi:hypothetical protein